MDEWILSKRVNTDLFQALPPKRRRYLSENLKRVKYAPDTEIIRKGSSGDYLGIIESGRVIVKNSHHQPRILTEGQTFGSEMLLHGEPSPITITTEAETTLLVLDRAVWLAPSTDHQPAPGSSKFLPLKKRRWNLLLGGLIFLILTFLTLGPSGMDYLNQTLPAWMIETGRTEMAETYLEFAIRRRPESAYLYGSLGDTLVLQERESEAIEAYQKALDLDAYLPWIHNNLGVLWLEKDQPLLAADYFLSARNLNPQNPDIYRNLGNAYYELERWEDAADAYSSALELDFSMVDIKAAWAGLILEQNRFVEARLVWEDVLRENPRHPLALKGLGVISLLEGDPHLAMSYLNAARYLDPADPSTHLYLGMVWEDLEKPEQAAGEYQQAADLGSDPELVSLTEALLQVVTE